MVMLARSLGATQRPCVVTSNRHHLGRRPCLQVRCQSSADGQEQPVPSGPVVTVTLRQPAGLVFAQKPDGGPVYVDEVAEGGNAAKSGKITKGDILSKCSAVILKAGKEGQYQNEGYGQRPYDNWERVEFDCEGQAFSTVMSALKSNNSRWGFNDVILTFRKPV
mmetsp:Transcript_8857/g.18927  ORF Transcript_8857/g.18927 Transcript_8857/m.18927 type:complete len:164 (+) Transcript_8857:48-539(+)